jgi:molybdenum cofactor synthesis domain-containing protein
MSASILTIGNELVSGDVENSNGAWLAKRLEALGQAVQLIAIVRDELDDIVRFVRDESERVDHVIITGGLGGTPDDITREAIAAAFGVEQEEVPELADRLRRRFVNDPEYAARWARLPRGSRPLENPLGGAPGFTIGNVYVLPGLPAEMEAMFLTVEPELREEQPIQSWRRTYRTSEAVIVRVLESAQSLHPQVQIGSYPSFYAHGSEVEIVMKSADAAALAEAAAWIERALEDAIRRGTIS